MALAPGTRLGPYEILAPVGAGGMGEVYRARDSRLDRDVAIKVLPEGVASSPELRKRFEREIRTLSQLSHPHICAVHDVGNDGGVLYLVMEYLDGKTLAAKLAFAPLPLDEVLRLGRQIAEALDAAHRCGIVHRDVKPGNVMLTKSGVKLLDFGLARALVPASEGGLTQAATATDLTLDGLILGTVGYMSPEQAEGKEVDSRTDIFALGSVLYEMATGRRAFEGGSRAATLSAVLTSQPPPMLSVRPELPPALEALVALCLAKSRDLRWQSAHDVNLQLEAIRTTAHPGVASGKPARRVGWAIAALAPAAFALVFLLGRPKPAPRAETVRFSMPPPAGRTFSWAVEVQTLAVSPDGSRIAFVSSPKAAVSPARSGGASPDTPRTPGVWVRDVASLDARPVPGTEDASSIFWAPDGKSLGFFTPGKLKRILLAEGASAVSICDLPPGGGKAGTWGADGTILFTSVQAPAVFRVPAAGGRPDQPIEAQASRGEIRLNWPWFLPDGKRFLYVARLRDGAGELMFAEPGKPPRVVAPMASIAQYVEPGYIVFAREGALLAQRFDPGLARLTGDPIPIADRVNYFLSTGLAFFAVSPSGTLVYHSQDDVSRLTWFDLAGRPLETIGPPGNYLNLAIGREGKRVFYDRTRSGIGTYDVWSWDLSRGVETPITNVTDSEFAPIELPDGKSIVYSANREGAPELFRRNLESGADERLTDAQRAFQQVQDLSPDGRTLVYVERSASGNFDIWTLALAGGKPTPFLQSSFDKQEVRFSPDGRFLAFISDESGQPEAYVTRYPGPGERVRLSSGGARLLQWSRDGKSLFYTSPDGRMMSLPVKTSPSLQTGVAVALFPIAGKPWLSFAVSRDGERLLAVVPEVSADEQPMTVVVHWSPDPRR